MEWAEIILLPRLFSFDQGDLGIKVSSLRLTRNSVESEGAAFIVRAERLVRDAAHDRKQAQHFSDANSEAASLRGGVAFVEGPHSKTINYRPSLVGHCLAPARR